MNQILVWSAAIILSTFLTSCEKSTDTPITVTKITPSAAEIGDAILVTGTGFNSLIKQDSAASAAISVFINGVQVTGIILDDTSIQVVIPAGITSGPVCITHEGKHICSSIEFTLLSRSPLSNSYLRATDHPGGTNIGLASVQAGRTFMQDISTGGNTIFYRKHGHLPLLLRIKYRELPTLPLTKRVICLEAC
jgi:hypothetical protein